MFIAKMSLLLKYHIMKIYKANYILSRVCLVDLTAKRDLFYSFTIVTGFALSDIIDFKHIIFCRYLEINKRDSIII